MSEVQSRTPGTRGRGGFRGGRGGYRGGRGSKSHSKTDDHESGPPLEEQGEVGELKVKYANKLPLLREVAEGWSDEDLVFALQETGGDEAAALDRITSGTISQWGEVKKKQPKTKETASAAETTSRGRGRGGLESRGRARATDRGGRGGRGARAVSQANGTKPGDKSTKTTDDGLDDKTVPTNGDTITAEEWANDTGKDKLESLETNQPKPAAAAAPGKSGGWAGLFAKPTPPPIQKKEPPRSVVPEHEPEPIAMPSNEPKLAHDLVTQEPPSSEPVFIPPPIEPIPVDDGPSELPSAPHSDTGAGDMTPGDALTEKNVHKLPDVSHPPPSATAASTAASTQDPMNPALPAASAIRPGMSGHAASALRATTGAGRSASFTRKVVEQQEAVIMPGNHAVDRAAVQFGKMGLNGEDIDADEDREDPETRMQLPDDSPSAPRASLPPSMPEAQVSAPAPAPALAPVEPPTEPAAQRPAPGLHAAPQQPSPQQTAAYADQYRYAQGQKPYDPFSQQSQLPQGASEPFSSQLPGQAHPQIPTSAQQEYAQYYAREYGQYYGGYGQDGQRAGSAFGTSAQDAQNQYATAGPRGYVQQEMGASGNNTPNPSAAGHQAQQSQHMQQGPGSHAGYPYGAYGGAYGSAYPQYGGYNNHRYGANRPMFDDARRQEDFYNNQYGYSHNQGYGSSYKSNMYGGPQHQYSHEYSSSPANTGNFGGRDGAYGRSGSAQPSETQQSASTGSNAFSGMPDPFGRTPSGFGQSQHGGHGGSEDPAKPTGPSPSLQSNRPGSAANVGPGQQGSGLPHPQSAQQAFGGYPQYAGFGNQNTHNTGYGAYGSNNAFGGYGGGYGRGWTGSYGSGQH